MMNYTPPVVANYRLLLIDDDPDIHELVKGLLLSKNTEILSAFNGDQAVEIALREPLDMILLDYEMPGMNGLEVFRRLRSEGIPDSIPVVFITGNTCHKILTECFKAGASDYIHKPFCAAEFRARTISIMDRQRLMRQMEFQAMHDPLTHLFNRASIRMKIQSAINRGPDSKYALLFLDCDRFKLVNDSLGHNIGDELLKQIADRLRGALICHESVGFLSSKTAAARLGGDEFVILLENLRNPNDALLVADRLLAALEDPYLLAGQRVCSTASIGVVNNVQDYVTPDEVLRDADTAMYEAKSTGRGRFVLFNDAMHSNAEERLTIENELRSAIENDELFLVYQPIVSLQTGRTEGFEALIRWNHPQRGLLAPGRFLPAAEDSGLIVPIGMWVLDRACEEFASWQNTLGADAPSSIHVNVSRKQLLRDLVEKVKIALKKHDVAAECLHLEITESEIMQNPEVAKATLTDLRKLGVKIDMDDFGTGHSSLACLQELPIDVLKIDRSFIVNMDRNRSFAALIHAITTLGQNLGLTVLSEGIETAEQLAMLQFMECNLGQGYLFAKPMPSHEIPGYLSQPSKLALDPFAVFEHHEPAGLSASMN